MLFSSPIFLYLFLPLVLFIYYLAPTKFKNLLLLFFSLLFYTWGEKELVLLILLSSAIDYSAALIIESGRRKIGLYLSLIVNIGLLVYFKYVNFVYTNLIEVLTHFNWTPNEAYRFASIALPLGISFYTFQTMSYTIDVYRGKVKANRNFIDFACYVTLFPQLIAGPIVRYHDIQNELKARTTTGSQIAEGVQRFIIGLAKKMIIANNCAFLADGIFALSSDDLTATTAWLGAIAYAFQIYFDFSGYSDMAIGLGKMLGFNFPENFNYPYISKSLREFWRRWHITLSEWFRDYVYIPLGGNRNQRTLVNLLIVFFLTGLWHGANWTFIVWGLFHGFFLILERTSLGKTISRWPKFMSHFYVIPIIFLSWVIFRSDTITDALQFIAAMFSFDFSYNAPFLNFYLSTEVILVLLLATLASTPIFSILGEWLLTKCNSAAQSQVLYFTRVFGLLVLFAVCMTYVAVDSYNPFIYFRF